MKGMCTAGLPGGSTAFSMAGFSVREKMVIGLCLLMTVLFGMAVVNNRLPETKKGVGVWNFSGVKAGLKRVKVSWYYNWLVEPPKGTSNNIEFVPMVWGKEDASDQKLAIARKHGRTLLTFNEPDHQDQAWMTVDEVLQLWPKLEATGMRLGSPSPADNAADPESWLGQFMKQAEGKGYRVDFICLHNYQNDFSDPKGAALKLRDYLLEVHGKYGKPIWLTEFALANWSIPLSPATTEQQKAYIHEVVPMLESLPFVERYAWFALPPSPQKDGPVLSNAKLCNERGKLNAAGEEYRSHRSRAPRR